MKTTLSYFPLGNADTHLIEFDDGTNMLIDFANMRTEENKGTICDLFEELSENKDFDVVVFSHAHDDHVKGSSDFFYLEHSDKYQGEERHKIKEMWVSSAFILDTELPNVDDGDAKIIRNEARYRLENNSGIKVFSEPDALNSWLESKGISYETVSDKIVHAGTLLENTPTDNVDIFVHAPFSDDAEDVSDKNDPSIVFQMCITNGSRATRLLFMGDAPSDIIDKIVDHSKTNENEQYLEWDLYDIPHHCSNTGLNEHDSSDYMTEPTENVKWLLSQGNSDGCKLVASCDIITNESKPPHIQAKRAYKHYSPDKSDFLVTMEHPNATSPDRMTFKIDQFGLSGPARPYKNVLTTKSAPRAGFDDE